VDLDELVAECEHAVGEHDPRLAVRTVLEGAVRDRRLIDALATAAGGVNVLHNGADLTVLNVVWPPLISLFPHDHRMWAAIGIYGGQEDNTFYRRQGPRLVAVGGKALAVGEVLLLGDDAIHSVQNPTRSYTGAIHVYGGDFIGIERSQWDADTLEERPYDLDAVRGEFARAEQQFNATRD
jgi:predicted metal-dependent enzyme (double-stranded beta helix superfamily)